MYTIDYLLNQGQANEYLAQELTSIRSAYDYATEIHKGQFRKNGDELITHPLSVAGIVVDLKVDATTVIAALLHEAALDETNLPEIKEKFGEETVEILGNLNQLSKLKLNDYQESSSNYLRKVLVGLSTDVRVLIIRLADRVHSMRTLDGLSEHEQKRKALETIEVLIPIAHRLGINSIKSELEDLSLKYSKPDVYNEILEKLTKSREELNESLEDMKNIISDILVEHNVEFHIKARVKSVHSIYTKLTTGRKWSDIYDILAMRLIVPTETDCYLAVGLIHAKFRPIPKRFKDYIAMPKENMYQSLHTSVFGVDGHIFEIQLRTPEMDVIAENGIASHWSYKEHGVSVQNLFEQKLEMFRNIIDSNKEETNDEIFIKNMEEELFSKQIYVFTPKGDVMELPQGSTPIDFAYRIHSEIGDHTVSAIVNDNIVPLNYELNDGDIIKINTNNQAKPSQEWINFAKTSQAKSKIRSYFSKKDREIYIERGKELFEKEIRKQKLTISDENINKILEELKLANYEELLLNIGSLRYNPTYVINIINEDKKSIQDIMLGRVNKIRPNIKSDYKNDIIVANTDNIKVSIASCCNPLPGDEIIGYVTKGEGISVHKTNCHNIINVNHRLISVEWNINNEERYFNAKLIIKTNSSKNNVLEIVTKASLVNVSIQAIKEKEEDIGYKYETNIKVKNRSDLSNYIDELKTLNYVTEVKEQ